MGSGSSKAKPDNYVLRLKDDIQVKPIAGFGEGSMKKDSGSSRRRSGSISNIADDIARLDPNASPSLKSPRKSKSSRIAVSPESEKANPTLGSQGAQSSMRMSSKNLGGGGTGTCSDYYPWLLKNTKLTGATLNDFEFGPMIGKGYSGTVRVMRYKKDRYCVFKAVRKDVIMKRNDMRHVQNEKEVLQAINCSFCIKIFTTFQDRSCVYFALEYAPGGELFHRLDRKMFFPSETAKFYVSEVFVAIEHIQSLGFVYRDLKPENIMIDEEGHIKLVDFGFSRAANKEGMMKTLCGTPAYLAPEILDSKFTGGYTKIVDWWSFGILIYELVTGKTPFSKNNKESHYEIFLRILQNKIWFPIGFDSMSKDLVSNLTLPTVTKRLCDSDGIKRHGYFTMDWQAVVDRRLLPPFKPKLKTPGDTYYFNNKRNNYTPMAADSGAETTGASYEFADF